RVLLVKPPLVVGGSGREIRLRHPAFLELVQVQRGKFQERLQLSEVEFVCRQELVKPLVSDTSILRADEQNLFSRFLPVLRLYQRTRQRRNLVAVLSHSFEDPVSLCAVQNVILALALPNKERERDAVFQNALLQLLKVRIAQFLQPALQRREVSKIEIHRRLATYFYRFHLPILSPA